VKIAPLCGKVPDNFRVMKHILNDEGLVHG
jgi:hypothetical protein